MIFECKRCGVVWSQIRTVKRVSRPQERTCSTCLLDTKVQVSSGKR